MSCLFFFLIQYKGCLQTDRKNDNACCHSTTTEVKCEKEKDQQTEEKEHVEFISSHRDTKKVHLQAEQFFQSIC